MLSSIMTRRAILRFTGIIWFLMGTWLFYKGLRHLSFSGMGKSGSAFLICAALFAGFLKGRFVLSKSVARVAGRISAQSEPLRLSKAYAPSYWCLIAGMMALGMLLNVLPVSSSVRAAIDIAIGSALVFGALLYFKITYGKAIPSQFQANGRSAPQEEAERPDV